MNPSRLSKPYCRRSRLTARRALTLSALAALLPSTAVQAGVPAPAFSSRPGAPYTIYLDFGGFSYTGNWGGRTPGVVPAYNLDANANAFSTTEQNNIREMWARVAEQYSAFNINVTTVDPAVAAGQASTDLARQTYYDATARLQHTVVGGSNAWYDSGAGGVSFVGVVSNPVQPSSGLHTNWIFPVSQGNSTSATAIAAIHENGHAFGLYHQGDYNGNTLIADYSTNNNASGTGSYAPNMGVAYSSQRALWRVGNATANSRFTQNDFGVIGANSGITLVNDGIGHSIPTATILPLNGTAVIPAAAKGNITPTTLSNPNPIGVNNYTKDYFNFFSIGSIQTITCIAGSEYITPGVADPGATLDATLNIYNAAGTLVGTGTRSSSTLSNAFTAILPAGNYYAEIASVGGYTSTFDSTAKYFTSGSYFLTGSNLYTKLNLVGKTILRANLTAQDLSSANLTSATLTSTNFSSANLTSANLTSAGLFSANLTSATLLSANLTSANLARATLTNTNFTSATILGTSFESTQLSFAQLASTASFQQHNLTGLGLVDVNVTNWNLSNQNLTNANFSTDAASPDTQITGLNLTASTITGANFSYRGLTYTQLTQTLSYQQHNLAGVGLSAANFPAANLASQNLTAAALRSANLQLATFDNATLTSADLTSANLAGASLVNATLLSATLAKSNLNAATLAGANLASADLSSTTLIAATLSPTTNLDAANLSFADLRQATGYTPLPSTLTRAAILPTGQIEPFAFTPNETLRIRPNPLPATTTGPITVASPDTATIALDPATTLLLSPAASTTSNTITLNNIALSITAYQVQPSTVRATTPTATPGQPRTLLPTVTILSSLTITNDGQPLDPGGNRQYFGLLDLGTNDALFHNGSLPDLADMARAFLTSSGTQGLGSTSTLPNTQLALFQNATPDGTEYFSTFDGQTATTTDILARFTYTGDTNLDGILDGTDLANLLEGLSTGSTGWQSGDLNYDNTVNATDFTLFTTAYNAYQLNPLPLGSPTDAAPSGGGSVPEPSSLASLSLLPTLLRRPRRTR